MFLYINMTHTLEETSPFLLTLLRGTQLNRLFSCLFQRYLDTSLLDIDVQPSYIRVMVKDKVSAVLISYVNPIFSHFQRTNFGDLTHSYWCDWGDGSWGKRRWRHEWRWHGSRWGNGMREWHKHEGAGGGCETQFTERKQRPLGGAVLFQNAGLAVFVFIVSVEGIYVYLIGFWM